MKIQQLKLLKIQQKEQKKIWRKSGWKIFQIWWKLFFFFSLNILLPKFVLVPIYHVKMWFQRLKNNIFSWNIKEVLKYHQYFMIISFYYFFMISPFIMLENFYFNFFVTKNFVINLSSTYTWRRQWKPTPVLLPGKSHGRRSLVGCSPWGHEDSDTTEWLHFHFSPSCIGEGNGNSLQCSCLENPRDREAWWAAVYGVAQSRTRLKWLSSGSSHKYWFASDPWDIFPEVDLLGK